MTTRKLLLNNLLDIGGVATLNNLYSPTARSFKGSLLFTRKLFKDYIVEGLIEKIEPIGKPMNKAREVFFCLTKKGAHYIGRSDEYKYKKYQKSPNNVMHESMKFDTALSIIRNFPDKKFTIRYDSSFYGVKPDILIRIESSNRKELTRFWLVEIERKKTIDRVFNEKIKRYEQMFESIQCNKSHNINQFTVLFVYTDIWFDPFVRPQQYTERITADRINQVNTLVKNLVQHYCKHLPEQRYRFTAFHNFHRLHEAVWLTPRSKRIAIN